MGQLSLAHHRTDFDRLICERFGLESGICGNCGYQRDARASDSRHSRNAAHIRWTQAHCLSASGDLALL
jgi:hypothetical protein